MPQLEPTDWADSLVDAAYVNDRRHVFHSWSAQRALDPAVIVGAEGSRMWDSDGRVYLDFSSQLVNVNLGHQHPKLVEAIRRQAGRLCTIAPSHANDMRSEAARLITERAPGDLDMVFFTNGGAEAVENAVRLAKGHTGRLKVLSAYRSYHGSTAGAISLTGEGRRHHNEPGVPGTVKFFGPYPYRSPFHSSSQQEECERALEHLRSVVLAEGGDKIAAVLLESVTGTNGVLVPPDGFLRGVRDICDEFGIVMICDEVMAGFGRCGEWFAVDRWGVTPDLITFAKGVNSGSVPIGGVIISRSIADTYGERVFQGGLTYSGHPLASATVVASIGIFEEERILDHVRMLETQVFGPRLAKMAIERRVVGEARGLGVFWALELVDDRQTRAELAPDVVARLAGSLKDRGLWPFIAGNRIHVVPPCNISVEDAHAGLTIIDEVLASLD